MALEVPLADAASFLLVTSCRRTEDSTMPFYPSPGVFVEEFSDSRSAPNRTWSNDCSDLGADVPTIRLADVGAAAFFGFTERIPEGRNGQSLTGQPVAITTWDEYMKQFGGMIGAANLPGAVHGYFSNGGKRCYVVSVRVPTAPDLPHTQLQLADVQSDDRRFGLRALESLDDIGLICAPDLMPASADTRMDVDRVVAVQEAIVAFCEYRHIMAILDTPPGLEPIDASKWREAHARDSDYAAMYYPWLQPSDCEDGTRIPPCGHVAGAYVHSYNAGGPHTAPANIRLADVASAELRVTQAEYDFLYPTGINVLRPSPDGTTRIWGARTLSGNVAFRPLQVRRLLNAIARSIELGTDWTIFQRHEAALRKRLCCSLHDFLSRLWKSGALMGNTEKEAFYVSEHLDETSSDPPNLEIGMAVHKAGVFTAFRIVFVSEQLIPSGDFEEVTVAEQEQDEAPKVVAPGRSRDELQPPCIFLSYGREDWSDFVRPLVERLRSSGFHVWLDQHLLRGGDDWMDSINAALAGCNVMLLCISPEAMASKYVKYEYRYFFREDKTILPLLCRQATVPPELSGIQYLDYSEQEALVERLREVIGQRREA